MRLFVALDIDNVIRQRIARFVDGVREFAPEARWVRPESMHVTLKFIGEKPDETAEEIKQRLLAIHSQPLQITFRGFGFFPTAKSARVFWVGIDSGPQLAALATAVDDAMFAAGIAKEAHPFSPHLTLARGAGRSGAPHQTKSDAPNRGFSRMQEKLAAMPTPDFGSMTSSEFYLYQSQLGRGGSKYTKLQSFRLRSLLTAAPGALPATAL